jgi:hypothetical protein
MADSTISGLTAAGTLTGTEEVAIVQSSSTKKTTVRDMAELVIAPIYTVDFMSSLITIFYAPIAFSIDSVTDLVNSPTTTILVNDASYTLGVAISAGDKITVSVSTNAVVRLITSL